MSVINVAILGFGTVGEGVYQTIQSHEEELTAILGRKVEVAAVLVKNKQKDQKNLRDILVTDQILTKFSNFQGLMLLLKPLLEMNQLYLFEKSNSKRLSHYYCK